MRTIRLLLTSSDVTTDNSASWTISNAALGSLAKGTTLAVDYIIAAIPTATQGDVVEFTVTGVNTLEVTNITNTPDAIVAHLQYAGSNMWVPILGVSYKATLTDLSMFRGATLTVKSTEPAVFGTVVLTIQEM